MQVRQRNKQHARVVFECQASTDMGMVSFGEKRDDGNVMVATVGIVPHSTLLYTVYYGTHSMLRPPV